MNKELIEIVNFYMRVVGEKIVFLELRVNPESPLISIHGTGFTFQWAANGYFRSYGPVAESIATSAAALALIEKYVKEDQR